MSDERADDKVGARNEWVVWVFLGLVMAVVVVLGAVVLATRVACGQVPEAQPLDRMASFFWTGEPGRIAQTTGGCTAPSTAVWITLAVVFGILVVLAIALSVAWHAYKQSDRYFVRQMRRRRGLARRFELWWKVSARAVRKAGQQVRPSLKHPTAEDVGLQFGTSHGIQVWGSMEDSICVWGPPRSGKGLHLTIDAILDAPGPVVSTSSRTDNMAGTSVLRSWKGPVGVFDPQGLSGETNTVKWSPITGCEDQRTANFRAWSLVRASGLGSSEQNQEWQAPAATIIASLLHAAALSHRGVDDLYAWSANPAAARTAVTVLQGHGAAAAAWGTQLEGVIDGDPRMRANQWFGVTSALSALAVPEYRRAMSPDGDGLDIDRLLDESGTLYIMGTQTGGSSVGPFLIALLDAVTERAQEKAAEKRGNRLDPPLALVLDEIANLSASWPNLKNLMSAGGGSGIMPMAVFQSGSQARNQWGTGEAEAIFDNATISLLLGGLKNSDDLEKVSKLAGQRRVVHTSRSQGDSGRSVSEQSSEVPILSVDELRRVPFGYGVMIRRTGRPIFLELRRWTQRKDAQQIKDSLSSYDSSLLAELISGEDEVNVPAAEPARVSAEPAAPTAARQGESAAAGDEPWAVR